MHINKSSDQTPNCVKFFNSEIAGAPTLKTVFLFFFILTAFFQAHSNTFKNSYPRMIITSDLFPWRAMGKLLDSPQASTGCTAFLVSDIHILTNAHCVYGTDGAAFSSDYYFLLNPRGNSHNARSYNAKPIFNGRSLKDAADHDWALLELDGMRIGTRFGFLGFEDQEGNTLPSFEGTELQSDNQEDLIFQSPYAQLCRDTKSPFRYYQQLEQDQDFSEHWFQPPTVYKGKLSPFLCMPAYSADSGYLNLTLAQKCTFVGSRRNQIGHNCSSTRESSGAPLFYRNGKQILVVALHRGEDRNGSEDSLVDVFLNANNFNLAVKVSPLIEKIHELRESLKDNLNHP